MTDLTPQTDTAAAPTRKKRQYVYWGVAIFLLVVVGGAFLASRAGLDKALVKQQLDDFIARAKQQARDRGRDLEITYSGLEVAGSFANKHVQVQDVTLKIKPLQDAAMATPPRSNSTLQVTTPRVDVYPTAADLSSLRVELPQPINFASQDAPDKSLMKVVSDAAPSIAFGTETLADVSYRTVEYRLPSGMEFTYLREQRAVGAEDQAPQITPVYETLSVTIMGGGLVETNIAEGSDLGSAKINFGSMTVTPKNAPEGAVTIAGVHGEWNNTLNEAKQNVQLAKFAFGPLQAPEGLIPFAPIALNFDAVYTGAMPKSAEAVASIESQESKMELKELNFSAKDSAIKASANFTANAGDVLPLGDAKVSIENLPYLMTTLQQYKLINTVQVDLANALLAQITGTPAAEIKNTEIEINRARGGAFKIGKSTFEELFATFLKVAMQQKPGAQPMQVMPASPEKAAEPAAPEPATPEVVKPKASAPIQLHDQSTRG